MNYDFIKTGEIFQQRRKELNLTQQQVSDKAHIQLRQYQRLESGEQSIESTGTKILFSICQVLEISPEFLFGFSVGQKPLVTQTKKSVILPPIDDNGLFYQIPQYAYFLLVCEIPFGMIATSDSIINCLRKVYNQPNAEINNDLNSFQLYDKKAFPYWRVVSTNGHLMNMVYFYKEKQRELLEKENMKVIKRDNIDSYEVVDYKKHLFYFDSLKITVLDSLKQIEAKMKIKK